MSDWIGGARGREASQGFEYEECPLGFEGLVVVRVGGQKQPYGQTPAWPLADCWTTRLHTCWDETGAKGGQGHPWGAFSGDAVGLTLMGSRATPHHPPVNRA